MATFTVTFEIGDLPGTTFQRLEGLVDTGATFTVIPRPILEELGIRPTRRGTFALANGQVAEYEIGQATVRLQGLQNIVDVIFGPPGTGPLIGAVTLESLLLGVDPVNEALVPVTGRLKPL
ncbi:MAG: retroviral-like aspartic protease family protein [Chloroflexi bacterium]|nr:retroviral-like aspartic protease family protein [Chloroflexota bacterium]